MFRNSLVEFEQYTSLLVKYMTLSEFQFREQAFRNATLQIQKPCVLRYYVILLSGGIDSN